MNASLPAGIEAYLKEAGFTATEMFIMRRLVEEDSLTIRELGGKSGKSPGVLDQAMKRLFSKRIAEKKIINGQPKYSIHSLENIVSWVQKDMDEKKKILDRRHQNFESFIASLKVDKKRPDMEYFHGSEGIKQAYLKLLDTGEELLTQMPVTHLAEDDSLRVFRVDLFRKRQVRKIFHRVLAPDSMLARRFRTRDPFEYRRTLLLPEDQLPITFEKTIAGDIIACINAQDESACLLKYPELAKAERDAFNALWSRGQALERGENPLIAPAVPLQDSIPLKTRFYSSFREFLLSRRSIATFFLFALLAGALTFGLYKNNREMNLQRMRDKVMAIAATGALQFDGKDINAVWNPDDISKPEYAKLIATLGLIRRSNPDIQYAYLMRKTDKPQTYAFIADADSLDPTNRMDVDGNVDGEIVLSYPGESYDISTFPVMADAFDKPMSGFGEDQWGNFVSGFAPIFDENNEAVAIIGIDMFISQVDELSADTFSLLAVFVAIFLLFGMFRYIVLNQPLIQECFECMRKNWKMLFLKTTFVTLCLAILFYGFQSYKRHLFLEQTGERLKAIAATAAHEFDPDDLDKLRFARDMKTEAYQRVYERLNRIRNDNPDTSYAYIFRPTDNPVLIEFIADADSNFNTPLYTKFSIFDDAPLNEFYENIWPGYIYDNSLAPVFVNAIKKPAYGLISDQWGNAVTGCAPILNREKTVGILCLDINAFPDESIWKALKSRF